MRVIRSRDNALYKSLHRWSESSAARRRSGVSLLDGVHLVQAYLASGATPKALIASEAGSAKPEVAALMAAAGGERVVFADALFDELAATATPQGIVALVETPRGSLPRPEDRLVVLLENLQDPGNAGAILRAAAAAGASHVLFSKGSVFAWSPRVMRAAQGAHFVLQVVEEVDALAFAASARPARTLAALMPHAQQSVFTAPLPLPLALVIGNEGAGISAPLVASCNSQVTIPMPGRIESLNAAQAATVALFEIVRRGSSR